MNVINVEYFNDVPLDFSGIAIREDGSFSYYSNGKIHCELGPAIYWKTSALGALLAPYNDDHFTYVLHNNRYEPKRYWKIMYKKYKGTVHEAECLAEILGAK